MLTDKQIEREEAFCDDWYMVRKMGRTPTYADAIVWADKAMIEKLRKLKSCYESDLDVEPRVYERDIQLCAKISLIEKLIQELEG